ncbi:MAG: GYF domain-containing protein [Acidobacteriota bacterium]
MDDSGVLLFRCASCGREYRLALAKVPPGGASGPCKTCGQIIAVRPDGSLAGAERISTPAAPEQRTGAGPPTARPAVDPGAASRPLAWELQTEGQSLGPFGPDEMRELIASGRLSKERMVRSPGGEWAPAGSLPALAGFFPAEAPVRPEADEGPIGSEEGCYAHPSAPPSFQCTQCMRYLCDSCVVERALTNLNHPVKVCGACGGTVTALRRKPRWTPFYRDMPRVLSAPLRGTDGLLAFGVMALLQVLKIPCRLAGMAGLAGVLILTVFQTAFYLHLIREVASGSYDFPEWPEMNQFVDMFFSFLKVLFVTVYSLVPAFCLVLLPGASAMNLLLGPRGMGQGAVAAPALVLTGVVMLCYAFYLPLCIAIVAVFETVLPALNPVLIVRIIARIGMPYVAAVALFISLMVIVRGVVAGLGHLPMAGMVSEAVLTVYGELVSAYILGRVIYENEERIAWH